MYFILSFGSLMKESKKYKEDESKKNAERWIMQNCMNEKSIKTTHLTFWVRCEMVSNIRGNYKSTFLKQGGGDA